MLFPNDVPPEIRSRCLKGWKEWVRLFPCDMK